LKYFNNLAIQLPASCAVLLALGGCYTVFTHPQTDLTGHDDGYRDCASCHADGFAQPPYGDPYAYAGEAWRGYYACPWWIDDCGAAYGVLGGTAAAGGRTAGSRGIPGNPGANAPPMIMPGGGVGGVAPTAAQGKPETEAKRKLKKSKNEGAEDKGSDPGKKKDQDRDDPDDPQGDPP